MLLQKMPALVAGATRTPISAAALALTSRGLVGSTQALIAGVSAGDWFGPGQPLPALAPAGTEPRAKDYEFSINTQFQTRRTESGVSYAQLRALARGYDLLRLVIETRKDQVAAIPLTIRVRKEDGEPHAAAKKRNLEDPRIKELTAFFRSPDGTGWQTWIRKALEDVFVVDALSILPRWNLAGKIGRLEIIDGATIDRKFDAQGRTPEPPSVAYQQILKQLPAINLMAPLPFALRSIVGAGTTLDANGLPMAELVYRPRNVLPDKFYGLGPVEQIVTTVNIALRRQMSQLSFYTDGNINDALISVDESWGAAEIKRFQDMYDGTAGDQAARRRTRFMPAWKAICFPRNEVLKDEFDEWLARIVCYAFSVAPTWAVKQNNRATAQQSAETADEEGLAPILNWIEELVTDLIRTFWGYDDIEASFQDKVDPDPLKRAQVHQIYLDEEVLTPNEVREELGRDPIPGGDTPIAPPATELPLAEKALRGLLKKTKRELLLLAKADETPPKSLAVSPDQDFPGRATAESDIETILAAAFDALREKLPGTVADAYELVLPQSVAVVSPVATGSGTSPAGSSVATGKTADEVSDDIAEAAREVAAEIAESLDLSALDEVAVPVEDALKGVAIKAARKALRSLEITDKGLFNLANENAAAFARDRGAELVGRKWVDGELVENPDARWAITESTRDKVRDLVERAYTEGMTPAELKEEIEDSTEFSAGRAKLIAKTETAKASVSGTITGWAASGLVTGKQSLLSDDHDLDDECNDAAEEGAIPLDEDFSTGDDGPPYHPGCNCSLIAVLAKK